MCCFTGVVESVSGTKIFARPSREGRQFLVYSMTVQAADDLAMVLPLPAPKQSAEDAVKFIDLENYADFFGDMELGFPGRRGGAAAGGLGLQRPNWAPLKVVDVGSFEASFVPTVADFARLDRRFRLPEGTWEKLPGYKAYGFAVFKLKAKKSNYHPMAFEFPRANRRQVFFPTVHIHDGEVHQTAEFDHDLYFQLADADYTPKGGWVESARPAGMFMNIKKSQGMLDPELHCYRRQIRGEHKNADVLV